jgi:hypothetical protein
MGFKIDLLLSQKAEPKSPDGSQSRRNTILTASQWTGPRGLA